MRRLLGVGLALALAVGCERVPEDGRDGQPPETQAAPGEVAATTPREGDLPGVGADARFDLARARLETERNTIAVAERSQQGVVFITTRQQAAQRSPENPFEYFYGGPGGPPQPQEGSGSGFVIDAECHILTNNHVVTLGAGGSVGNLSVRFKSDARVYPATVVGRAPAFDIALLRIEAEGKECVPLPFGDSDVVKVGAKAIAMGSPFGQLFTTTEGIVSATGRELGELENLAFDVIQTDAAVNPGNSGGPLLNSSAEVIGINTSILSPAGQFGGAQFGGIAFAVPINIVKGLLPDLRAGRVIDVQTYLATRPRLGLGVQDLAQYPDEILEQYDLPRSGLLVTQVEPGGPAADAGLTGPTETVRTAQGELPVRGTVITAVDGTAVESLGDLRGALFEKDPGSTATLTVLEGGEEREVPVRLEVIGGAAQP